MAFDPGLAERVRAVLADAEASPAEKKMFGAWVRRALDFVATLPAT